MTLIDKILVKRTFKYNLKKIEFATLYIHPFQEDMELSLKIQLVWEISVKVNISTIGKGVPIFSYTISL